ncbi:signal peptidase I [Candidatus Uhrbacteria bacterium]|nr:signal peptidase I [Candidatus Uhrbacteria bacterium]
MKRSFLIFIAASGAIALVAFFYVRGDKKVIQSSHDTSCITGTEEKIVDGDSMHGVIESGAKVQMLRGYYKCNAVQRGDVVVFQYAEKVEPIIKIVKAIPGDRFSLQQEGAAWRVLVNDVVLTNSRREPHVVNDASAKLLSLYVHDYRGVVPKDTYLIFGNLVEGSFDSTRLGLVGKEGILGKVVMP